MKVLGIFIFLLFVAISFNLVIDILLGLTLSQAMHRLLNPFWVIEPGEYVMLAFFLFITIGQQILYIKKNKN
ncbi:hypothetical protein [Halobacillus sp. B23F22_1]|uniref:hypothetical protein n=1 Tax=Halobacillus sp. B23F22_1 TaxID=3459514 RepID=UPI00373E50F0